MSDPEIQELKDLILGIDRKYQDLKDLILSIDKKMDIQFIELKSELNRLKID